MKILWLIDELQTDAHGAPIASFLASYRYRVRLPAEGLNALGHECMLTSFERVQEERLLDDFVPNAVVIGKLLPSKDEAAYQHLCKAVFQVVAEARGRGIPVIADVNDNHFSHPYLGPYWQKLVQRVDRVVVGSEAMGAVVATLVDTPVSVIGDPLAMAEFSPRVYRRAAPEGATGLLSSLIRRQSSPQRLHCLWFGNLSNWEPMSKLMKSLGELSVEQPLLITVLTAPSDKVRRYLDDFNQAFSPRAEARFLQWSEERTGEALRDAHLVLLPSDPLDNKKAVKTSNRLTDSIHAGAFVLASPLPAYLPFQSACWLGENLVEGLRWYLDHSDEALQRIVQGQALVKSRASPEAIAKQWEAVLGLPQRLEMSTQSNEPLVKRSPKDEGQIKLNLGCGDKILEGYVNVDVAPSRAGKTPDVLCDLRDLSVFPDGHVDEILSVHVVEHFWRWEVKDILSEWLRVLKPGGRMILECPNLISACEALLNNPELASRPDQAGQRSMWVFYGDPAWKDPLMAPRWGYTPHSLAALMAEIGLVSVRQEPAQFKLKEPESMRLVGEKRHQ